MNVAPFAQFKLAFFHVNICSLSSMSLTSFLLPSCYAFTRCLSDTGSRLFPSRVSWIFVFLFCISSSSCSEILICRDLQLLSFSQRLLEKQHLCTQPLVSSSRQHELQIHSVVFLFLLSFPNPVLRLFHQMVAFCFP